MILTLKIEIADGAVKLDDDFLEEVMVDSDVEDVDDLSTDQKVQVANDTVEDFFDQVDPEDLEFITNQFGGTIQSVKLDGLEIEEDEEIEIDG
ncbi:hypothetical protein SEA_POKYPUPPY_47 [Gordonia phage PokyPuppy]|nr:hypothetical protein SEA_POKYPUPPY_47 [Gordonia phage PokyPuppy]